MPDRPSATDMQPTLCSVAKRMASEHFGIRLDQSVRSVRSVEKILGAIHKEHLKSRGHAAFDGIALEYAAYIVEVIQGQFGPAIWQRDCPRQGADTFPLYWRNQVLYPYTWCRQRIYGGAGDDVWSRFRRIVLGKSAHRWWPPFGRRATDRPAGAVAQLEAPGAEPPETADGATERRTRHPADDRRPVPARQELPDAPGRAVGEPHTETSRRRGAGAPCDEERPAPAGDPEPTAGYEPPGPGGADFPSDRASLQVSRIRHPDQAGGRDETVEGSGPDREPAPPLLTVVVLPDDRLQAPGAPAAATDGALFEDAVAAFLDAPFEHELLSPGADVAAGEQGGMAQGEAAAARVLERTEHEQRRQPAPEPADHRSVTDH